MVVLVGYASTHGATRGIAERIAARLAEQGHEVEVRPVGEGGGDGSAGEVDGYRAVVLGSAVHDNTWLAEAVGFVRRNEGALAERPVWLFSVGMARVLGGTFAKRVKDPEPVAELRSGLHARDHRLFAGALERDHLPTAGRLMYGLARGRYGDFRDWKEIDAWAGEIDRALGP